MPSGGSGFESQGAHKDGGLAQFGRAAGSKPVSFCEGSNPSSPMCLPAVAQQVVQRDVNAKDTGSNPVPGAFTMFKDYVICDRCGAKEAIFDYSYSKEQENTRDLPDKWMKIDSGVHLCPHCARKFKEVKEDFINPYWTEEMRE